MQKLLSKTRQAINDFNLIEDGDKIAVALSGGKDSITLLYILKNIQRFLPEKFELIGIAINTGDMELSYLDTLCKSMDIPFHEIQTHIKEIVFQHRKEKNPCSLCATLRRGALNNAAEELGCNKLALGHHKDDAIQTLMLSMCYESRINCFSPKSHTEKNKVTVIRPMVYINESKIKNFIDKENINVIKNTCPIDGHTKRSEIDHVINKINSMVPGFRESLFKCLNNTENLFIWDKEKIK